MHPQDRRALIAILLLWSSVSVVLFFLYAPWAGVVMMAFVLYNTFIYRKHIFRRIEPSGK